MTVPITHIQQHGHNWFSLPMFEKKNLVILVSLKVHVALVDKSKESAGCLYLTWYIELRALINWIIIGLDRTYAHWLEVEIIIGS